MRNKKLILLVVAIPITALLVWILFFRNDRPPVYDSSQFNFQPAVLHTFNPDSTLKLNIIRFSPKVSSDRYVIQIRFEHSSLEIKNDLLKLKPELSVSDYDGNEIEIESPLLLTIWKKDSNSAMYIYTGYYSLSSDKHYRIDFSVLDNYLSELKLVDTEVTYSVGVLEYD